MFLGLAGQLFIDAALLGILVTIFARYNATSDFVNVLLVACGNALGGAVIEWFLAPRVGSWWSLLAYALLCGMLLVRFTGTNLRQTTIITILFFVVKIGVKLGLAWIMSAE